MGIKNLRLGIIAEPKSFGNSVSVTVTGGDQPQTFSIPRSGSITIPTSQEGAATVDIPVTADDLPSNAASQFYSKTFNITVSGGNIAIPIWKSNYRRNYAANSISSTSNTYDYCLILENPLFDGQPDTNRMAISKIQDPQGQWQFSEGVGTAIIQDGETFQAVIDIDYYVPA